MEKNAPALLPAIRGLIVVAVMSSTLIQVLDMTIVNVALPHMQGSLSATSDQVTWVLTSYLVASAILMPLTGYFTDRLGRKKYLLISIAGFVIASALCGAATTISEIVFFRLLQGAFGAALVPLSQAIMTDIYPEEDRGTAMAIWGMGVMIGPVLGPTLGGYLTDVASWRWNFYINVPIGVVSFFLAWRFVPDTAKHARKMDWLSLALISLSIGAMQYVLDRGNGEDWFSSTGICIAGFLAIMCFLGFLLQDMANKKNSVFDLGIFHDRNFTICCLLLAMMGVGLFGTLVVAPLMLESLFNYPVLTTGLVMAPRGISGMVSMFIVGKLIRYVDPRWLILSGILISGIGSWLGTFYSLNISADWIIGPFILQGLGFGMVFVPISVVAFSTLPAKARSEAAGLFSLLRTLGSSIGISIVITIFTRHTQMAWNYLGGFVQPFNPAVPAYLKHLHLAPTQPLSHLILAKTLSSQAQMVSFVHVYEFIACSFFVMAPIVFLLKKPKKNSGVSVAQAE